MHPKQYSPKFFIQKRLAHFPVCLSHCRCALLAQKIGERILYVVSSTMYLHVVGCSLWEAKLLVVFWKRLKTQYCFVLLKESLRHHSPHNCMFFFSYTIWQKIFVESVHILLNLLIRHCCAVLFIQLKNYINNLLTYMWLWKCPSIYGVLGKLEKIYILILPLIYFFVESQRS